MTREAWSWSCRPGRWFALACLLLAVLGFSYLLARLLFSIRLCACLPCWTPCLLDALPACWTSCLPATTCAVFNYPSNPLICEPKTEQTDKRKPGSSKCVSQPGEAESGRLGGGVAEQFHQGGTIHGCEIWQGTSSQVVGGHESPHKSYWNSRPHDVNTRGP